VRIALQVISLAAAAIPPGGSFAAEMLGAFYLLLKPERTRPQRQTMCAATGELDADPSRLFSAEPRAELHELCPVPDGFSSITGEEL
jgi:hypothetical protein